MLSDFLTSSYLQYKADTDAVAAWLVATARNCGFPVETLAGSSSPSSSAPSKNQSSKQLKDKARNLAREGGASKPVPAPSKGSDQQKLTIAVKDFVSLADYIAAATKPQVNVSASFAVVLNRAISVRREHGTQSTAKFSAGYKSQASTSSHGHFIGILEHVQQVLRPRMASENIKDRLAKPSGDASLENIQSITNKFDDLDVQEPSEAFLQAPEITMPTPTDGKPEVNYEAERMQDFEEACIAFHLLLRDFAGLQNVVIRTWTGYQHGLFDLVSASITTNSAIGIARRMQDDVQYLFDKYGGSEKLLNAFYAAHCKQQGEDPESKERYGDDMNFRTYDIAQSLFLPAFTFLNSFSDIVEDSFLLPFKPGYFGTFDRAKDWSKKSAREKYSNDKIIMLEILSDFLTRHRVSHPPPFEDEFTRGLRRMFDKRELPLWLAFAGQVYLNIHHVLCDDVQRGFKEFRRFAKLTESSIRQNLDFHSDLRIEGWPKRNDQAFEELLRFIDVSIASDPTLQKQKSFGLSPGEPFKVMKWHPMLCGLATFYLRSRYQELSLSFQSAWGSIMYSAHLYNALREEKLLKGQWIDMDVVMGWHDEIFVGERPPSRPEDYLKRFSLSMGWSAASFARNKLQADRLPEAKSGPKTMKPIANVSCMFVDRYCNGSGQTDFTETDLERILAQGVWEGDDEGEEGVISMSRTRKATTKKRWEHSHKLTAPELLECLRNTIQSEAMETNFDYLILHRVCWRMLRFVKKACDADLRNLFGVGCIEKESQLPFLVGYIFMAAMNTDQLGKQLVKDGEVAKSKLLIRAAEVVEGMMGTQAGSIANKKLAILGYEIRYEKEG